MEKFNRFYFEKFEFDKPSLKASFYYSFDKKESFIEVIDFNAERFLVRGELNNEVINNILFHIHIALWISYYKLFPTSELVVESGFLDDFQVNYWKNFFTQWLWEFFITNDLDPTELINFKNLEEGLSKKYKKIDFEIWKKIILPIWWWKDSIVSYSLIKEAGLDFDTYVFWKLDKIKEDTSKIMWKRPLLIKRQLSTNLFNLNSQWYYNGHVPITWLIAFISELVCYLFDYRYIVLSNEKSASEENTIWKGIKINHQYSKSLEFEEDFSNYVNKYISTEIKYFSLLRWLYEYKIAKIFSKQKEFFKDFSSCNNNFKIQWDIQSKKWCNKCEKCSFVFLILSNFLDIKELENIFWENLFNREDLVVIFKELIWLSNHKPFECVGTYEESFLSAYNAINKYKEREYLVLENIKNIVLEEEKN